MQTGYRAIWIKPESHTFAKIQAAKDKLNLKGYIEKLIKEDVKKKEGK